MQIIFKIHNFLKNSNILQFLYSETTQSEKFFDEKKTIRNAKIAKQSHACKGYVSSSEVKIRNSFNPELQFKRY